MHKRWMTLLPWGGMGLLVPAALLWLSPHSFVTVAPGLLLLPLIVCFLYFPMRWVLAAALVTMVGQVTLVFAHQVGFHSPMTLPLIANALILPVVVYGGLTALIWTYRRRVRRLMDQLSGRHDESMTELAGGVAHDLSNLLTIALGTARIMEHSGQLSDELRSDLDTVTDTVRSSTTLVKELAGIFAGRDIPSGLVEINALLTKTARHVQPSLPSAIDLQVAPSPVSLHVRGNCMQLQRCLLNLFINARDAIDGSGCILFSVEPHVVEQADADRRGVAAGQYAVLTVADTGCGMSSRTLSRAFRPLFTTKRPGRGNGIGLAIVDEIAHRLGGFVEVTSREGAGSRFDIYLPLAAEPGLDVPDQEQPQEHLAPMAVRQ